MPNSEHPIERVLAIDPGRDKCGVAIVQTTGKVLYHAVVPAAKLAEEALRLIAEHQVGSLLLGDRTAAREVQAALREAGVRPAPVIVDEHRSSEEGRRRYFQENPRRGWRRLLPVSLQTPPRAYDDYVAIVLAERYLRGRTSA